MSFFNRDKPPKNTESLAYKKYMAKKLNGQHLEYVLEKEDNEERIIGKNGSVNVRNGELIVMGSADILFRAKIEELKAWEFMSLNGAVLTAFELTEKRERTVIIYYSYYRK